MKRWTISIIFIVLLNTAIFAQPADSEIASITNHNDWGWTSIVQTNGIITLATVPDIGARIMQYDLDDFQFLYVNPGEIGKTYTPARGGFHGYGGYVVWPGPQNSRWGWPPPPVLDYGAYKSEIVQNSADSTSVSVTSEIEQWQAPGLRFERRMTVYKGTSRVRVDQFMINEASEAQSWSIWDVTQTIAKSPRDDYWVYFPINPNSEHGEDGVYFRDNANSSAWQGEVAPGIYGVVFRPEGKKLFADPHKGWIGYVDQGESKAYIKTFKIFEGETYPGDKGGGRVQVYLGTSNYEVEVASPIADLAPSGGRYSFRQDWYATTMNGPILDVNAAGAIEKRLYQDDQTQNIAGTFGVFFLGTAKLVVKDASGAVLTEGTVHDITPLEKLEINESIELPAEMASIEIVVYDYTGKEIGAIESATPDQLSSVEAKISTLPEKTTLLQNYPNPFNSGTKIYYILSEKQYIELAIYNLNGQRVKTLVHQVQPAGFYTVPFDGSNLSSGIYLCHMQTEGTNMTHRLLLIK
ncbi:T9SS type A sorting domain-containing protein [candidate division KSB1 bacterium]|nr:T9SS type A sorting domain-containing protein [candidate division KSB1 bacterium]